MATDAASTPPSVSAMPSGTSSPIPLRRASTTNSSATPATATAEPSRKGAEIGTFSHHRDSTALGTINSAKTRLTRPEVTCASAA